MTSKLITCISGSFTWRMKSQSISYLLNGSEHIYWILKVKCTQYGFVDKWPSRLEGQWFIEVGQAGGHQFSVESINFGFSGHAADPT